MATYLITGTSRGVGLELVKQLLDEPRTKVSHVVAVTRHNKSDQLNGLLKQHPDRASNVIIPDITNLEDSQKAVPEVEKHLQGKGLDVLVNNAGVLPFEPNGLAGLKGSQLIDTFNTNVVAVHNVTTAFLPLLRKGTQKKIVNMSTTVGSIALVKNFAMAPMYSYKVSKAALNMLTAQYTLEYAREGFTVFGVTPGWLKTDGGTEHAHLEPAVGVASVKEIIFRADPSYNGQLRNIDVPDFKDESGNVIYDGKPVPW